MNTLDDMYTRLDTLQAAREAAFSTCMDLVFERHDFYRERLGGLGLKRERFRSLADLSLLPITFKSDYMHAPERFVLCTDGLPLEMRTVWDTMYTTGSSGQPTPFVSTSYDFYNILRLQRNMLQLRGVRQTDVIANLFPLTQAPHGAWIRVLHAAASLNVPVFSALPGNPSQYFTLGNRLDEVIGLIASHRATILWGVPSYVYRVVQRAAELKMDFSAVRLLFVTGEALGDEARLQLLQALQGVGAAKAQISVSYGATEMQGGMVECVAGSGFHNALPAHLMVEVVDPETHLQVPDGQPGWVVLTHLQRRGTVLLRYALGDLSVRTQVACPHCGVVTDRLIKTPQRVDAMLKIKGMLVHPGNVVVQLDAVLGATPFQMGVLAAREGQSLSGDILELRVEAATDDALERELIQTVKDACGVTPIIVFVSAQSLMTSDSSWKARKFVDHRPH